MEIICSLLKAYACVALHIFRTPHTYFTIYTNF